MCEMGPTLQLLLVLATLVEGPPAPGGDLTSVTDQEIIRALSVLLTQDSKRGSNQADKDGVSFRRREQFDEEEIKLMKLVESERQSLSESKHLKGSG